MGRPADFLAAVKQKALVRQCFVCASCGTPIRALGNAGRAQHKFGEGAQAHHIQHAKASGGNDVGNCVIICQSCHYSVHEGGNYRFGTVQGTIKDYPFYHGKR